MTPDEHQHLSYTCANWEASHNAHDRCCGHWLSGWLNEHPPVPAVPVSELREWLSRGWVNGEFEALLDKYDPKHALPANPHPQGSYWWAREEHARGYPVRREGLIVPLKDERLRMIKWDRWSWSHADFIATDWEVVTCK